jgi:hypothetical protein
MKRLLYFIPASYFFDTRLTSPAFHFVFEYGAALVLALAIGQGSLLESALGALLSYVAFISLYEVGYLVNDLFSSRFESGGRARGPQGVSVGWVAGWFGARALVFGAVTLGWGRLGDMRWWCFFAALAITFVLHDWLLDKELKAVTFQWLAWFRFMAPVAFVVSETQVLGVGVAAATQYVAFRQFGYLDSKGLLNMPGRQRGAFRGVLALWPLPSAKGFVVLTAYNVVMAVAGTSVGALRRKVTGGDNPSRLS